MTFVTADSKHIIVPWRQDLLTLIPHAHKLEFRGDRFLVLPNSPEEAKLCRNLGVGVPSPILTRYDWAGQIPWDVQKTTAALLTESPRAYVLSTMGTGKTRSVMFAADYMMKLGRAKRMLVAAPLSTLTPVWETEVFRAMHTRTTVVLHGDKKKRLQRLATDADFYIINHHGLPMLAEAIIKRRFDIIVVDELAFFRNKSTDLWKALNRIIEAMGDRGFVWGLTGSPTPKAPTDAWGQIKLITPERTVRTMRSFQDQTMRQVSSFKWLPRPNANEIVFAAMQPSVRFTRDDIMELPETSYVDREVKLDPETAKAYKLLFDKMRMTTKDGQSITAVNEGVLQNKLLQVACGYIYTDKQTIYELPSKNRMTALDEVLDECDRKFIVFVPYVHALGGIAGYLRSKGHEIATVHGGTPRHARDKIFTAFQTETTPRGIVAHPQTMAHGLTLTEANTIIWFAPHHSLEIYEQANARIVRPGQTSKTLIVHLSGTPVERATYRRLRERAKMQGMLLELFRDQALEF